METKTAIIAGATGLVGNYLLQELIASKDFGKIIVFSRKELNVNSNKVETIVTDYTNDRLLKEKIKGNVLFCCLGTTIKKAGSKKAFREVDLDLPVKLGTIASQNKVDIYQVVSALGANASSGNFYLQTKGEMEKAISSLDFKASIFFRPSLLLGERKEKRAGENIGKMIAFFISPLMIGPLKKFRPVHGITVAKAMLALAHEGQGNRVVESQEIQKIADSV